MTRAVSRRRIAVVTGLSGAGKKSILHALEDLGYAAVDNPPLGMIGDLVAGEQRSLAIGVDARSSGFEADALIAQLVRLRADPDLRAELVFATASEEALLRRYTETRRRHPLAPSSRVADGIALEAKLLGGLREAADLLVDTTELPPALLRRLIESRFGKDSDTPGLTVSLVSFAYPKGLPREADLVFDARFLRNPHYVPALRARTGLDAEVGAYVGADPDFSAFFDRVLGLVLWLLPRFVQEGKRYVTVGVGCTGGRHRSVYIVELLTTRLATAGWRATRAHRELARETPPRENPGGAPISTDLSLSSRAEPPLGAGPSSPEAS